MNPIGICRLACCLLLLMFLQTSLPASWTPIAPAVAANSDEERITLDFKDVELVELIKTISELTGKNFLYDETVKGKVTIISPETMTLDETYQLFLTVLNVKGYTLVPSGKVNKIVPTKNAKQEGLPVITSQAGGASDQFITRLVRLDHLDVDTVATSVLAPLMPPTGNIITYPPTNTLILTETAATIDRMVKIMQQLDKPDSSGDLVVLNLNNADAEEVAQIAQEILEEKKATAKSRTARRVLSTGGSSVTKIIPYARTNSLIIVTDLESLKQIKHLVAMLDRQVDDGQSHINVYYLENADAETLAATMNQIVTGIKAQAKQADAQAAAQQTRRNLPQEAITITPDTPTNALIINAQPDDYALLKNIIQKLDVKRKQVYVEALILELSMDATRELGASLQGAIDVGNDSLTFGTSNLNTGTNLGSLAGGTTGTPSLLGQTVEGILLGGLFNPITVTGLDGNEVTVPAISALIDLSKTDSDVNILSAPRLLTSDNEEAEIIVGSNVPIITERLTDTGANDGLAQSVSIERQDVALVLRFTPQVTEGNLVRLNVFQEITDLATTSVGNVDQVGPTLTKRLVRNTVLAESRKTVVLGGLIGSNSQETVSKVPLLGDIPGLGWLFKSRRTIEKKTNLLVFITPTIINSPEDLSAVTRRNQDTAGSFMTEKMRSALPEGFAPSTDDNQPSGAQGAGSVQDNRGSD